MTGAKKTRAVAYSPRIKVLSKSDAPVIGTRQKKRSSLISGASVTRIKGKLTR